MRFATPAGKEAESIFLYSTSATFGGRKPESSSSEEEMPSATHLSEVELRMAPACGFHRSVNATDPLGDST